MADRLVMAVWIAGAACAGLAAASLMMQNTTGWRAWTPCVATLLAGLLAWRSRSRSVGGRLAFDAGHWAELSAGGVACATGPVRVCLDMQRLMLVRLDTTDRNVRWYWVDRDADRASWRDLRRALFANGQPAVDTASQEGRWASPA